MEIKIKSQKLPERCEVCHKADCFNPNTGQCTRCSVMLQPYGQTFQSQPYQPLRTFNSLNPPSDVEVERQEGVLRLRKSWYEGRMLIIQLIVTIFWNSVVFLIGVKFLANLIKTGDFGQLFSFVFLMPHIIVGVSLAYNILTTYLNHTTISVTNKTFSVEHKPLPWFGSRTIDSSELVQLYTKKGRTEKSGGEINQYYDLRAKLKNGKDIKLLGSLASAEVAQFLEQQVEEYLGIIDIPVLGEVPK